ncbi:ABC transporter permease [Paenibacillus faecis]|nr:ABC transporter permease [Paenibacillus faecis]
MEIAKEPQMPIRKNSRLSRRAGTAFKKMTLTPASKYLLLVLGAPVALYVLGLFLYRRRRDPYNLLRKETENELLASGLKAKLKAEAVDQLERKHRFFGRTVSRDRTMREAEKISHELFLQQVREETEARLARKNLTREGYFHTFQSLLNNPVFLVLTLIPGILMYIWIFLHSQPYLKFVFDRLVMSLFVILGVSVLVFTLLHLSPMNPAANILGETATEEQIRHFNEIYGLDQSYLAQLWNTLKGIVTFDLGKSFSGNEQVTATIARKFPVTLTLTLISLVFAVLIAVPAGILAAAKRNSFWDYSFMFIALIGLSIPNFWQGLIFILNFSIKLDWLPATFNPQNALSYIMPTIVLGTGLTAAVARMTRSSMLEVIHEDYILTAKAKGLGRRQVLLQHAARNAVIPVVTVIGLQFGGMLGGSAVTEKVFNISGIGSYIVDKQFIPDIPSILGGVIYTAITISLVNVIVDILYAFTDPRIRTKMKQQ